jgi:hypothetical protein
VETAVCTVERVLPGAAGCRDAGAPRGPLLRLVQDDRTLSTRVELQAHIADLSQYWSRALTNQGRTFPREIRLRIRVGEGGMLRARGLALLPPFSYLQGGPPEISIWIEPSDDDPRSFARALYSAAFLFALLGRHDPTAHYEDSDPVLQLRVNGWNCARNCEAAIARIRDADCSAGAYVGRLRRLGLIDADTVGRIEDAIREMHPRPFEARAGLPSGPDRLTWFQIGFENGRRSDNPFEPCTGMV